MSRWRPEPDEERWLDVAARLCGALARDALTERAGGWAASRRDSSSAFWA
jgi:hypothetical protein